MNILLRIVAPVRREQWLPQREREAKGEFAIITFYYYYFYSSRIRKKKKMGREGTRIPLCERYFVLVGKTCKYFWIS